MGASRQHLGTSAGLKIIPVLRLATRSGVPGLHGEYRRALTQREYALDRVGRHHEDTELPITWRLENLPEDDDGIAAAARKVLLNASPLPLPNGTGTAYEHLNV